MINIMKNVLDEWFIDIDGLDSKMYIEKLIDDSNGVTICLKREQGLKVLKVTFDGVLSYRNTNESYLLKIWHDTEKSKLGKTFYIIQNSSYVDFFNEMSLGAYSNWEVKHFAIYTETDCVDVLSTVNPSFEWGTPVV